MKIVERLIQELFPGKRKALQEIDQRYYAIEKELGFPPSKRLWPISAAGSSLIGIYERQWQSMAEMETAYEKSFMNPDILALNEELDTIVKQLRRELYWPE